ncbi:MAG: hypothetical protein DCC74_10350 [Proteobacteria bacterium]|nr:MAG: hypothetical protein DCC74_10350 [Pseudomonadota bacterium]
MALEVFNGTSIPREFATAPMEYLWAKWKVLSATGELTLQRLTEGSSYPLRAHLSLLASFGDDFVHLTVGETAQRASDENPSGKRLSQSDALTREFADIYRRAAQTLKPAFVRFTSAHAQAGVIWQRLILPVAVPDGPVLLAVYSEPVNHSLEVFEHLFRTAAEAMIVASPIANDVGHTVDGWVLMMNDRARECLHFTGNIGNLRLSDLPQFRDIAIWGRLYAPKGAAATPLTTAQFDLELMRFPHAFGVRLRQKAGFAADAGPLAPALADVAPAIMAPAAP